MADINETKDYSKFTLLEGNRTIDENHIKRLQKLMLTSGNLTQQFPVVINENWEVIDGQHRIKALEQLGWPVFYTVRSNLNLNDVRAINVGHRNWTWRDYAISFAELGNKNYERLLALYEEFKSPFHTLTQYTGQGGTNSGVQGGKGGRAALNYRLGEFKLSDEDFQRARILLAQLTEIMEIVEVTNRSFQAALYYIMTSPHYDHKRMVEKMAKYGKSQLERARTVEHFLRSIEETYNMYARDEDKARLF